MRSSIRFEAMRESSEDYEMLRALAARDHDAADQICASAVSSFTDYIRNPAAFRRIEQRLMEALTEIAKEVCQPYHLVRLRRALP